MTRWRHFLLSTVTMVLALGMSGCGPRKIPPAARPDGWQQIEIVGQVTADLPPGLERVPTRGIDSEVAEYRSRSLTVVFDYGEHGGIPAEPGWRQERIVVNGRTATLVSGRYVETSELPLGAVVHFPDPDSRPEPFAGGAATSRSLTITARCRTEQDCLIARRIFESVRFRAR